MLEIGKKNILEISEVRADGYILKDMVDGDTLFMRRLELPEGAEVGKQVEVFIFMNAKREMVPTTMMPYIMPGEFGYLFVDEVSKAGALLDWGLSRPLFLPSREMTMRMRVDRSYLVYVYYDLVTRQIIATSRIDQYLNVSPAKYEFNDEVDILIASRHERGYKVIVNNAHWGMIYESEIFQEIEIGALYTGYVKNVREDGKIDISLQPQGFKVTDDLSEIIMDELHKNNGILRVSDRSDAGLIAEMFGCSKKSFKKSIGVLFKQRLIEIHEDYICLV
ncbi:MAG: GntR family transcriptional regulator [Paludibacteraceae bacterium]|nr:GntR family transcriptional regulator [Paludibacteraceae bacterium]